MKWSHSVVLDSLPPHATLHQAAPSMGFSRQEYWSGLPFLCVLLSIAQFCLQHHIWVICIHMHKDTHTKAHKQGCTYIHRSRHKIYIGMRIRHTLLPLLSHFSRVRLCATPETAAHQAPPSLGFSRQEHWSGLLFPSPMHESEKWKWSYSVVSNPQRSHGLQPSSLLCPWDFPGKSTGEGCHCLLRKIELWIVNSFGSL